jgi:hypothetical protein
MALSANRNGFDFALHFFAGVLKFEINGNQNNGIAG